MPTQKRAHVKAMAEQPDRYYSLREAAGLPPVPGHIKPKRMPVPDASVRMPLLSFRQCRCASLPLSPATIPIVIVIIAVCALLHPPLHPHSLFLFHPLRRSHLV